MIDPVSLLAKTAANYIAYKTVRGSVDFIWDKRKNDNQVFRNVECAFCLKVWSNSPERCPHCRCKNLKKLYKNYEFKKDENEMLVDSNLTMG